MLSVKSMKSISEVVEEILQTIQPNDILIAFDIDMTLTQPIHPAVYYPTLIKYLKEYKNIIATLPVRSQELPSMLAVTLPQRLVEDTIPEMISEFESQGIKMIAFTASLTGKIADNDRFDIKRYQDLQGLGISFDNGYPDITFTQFQPHRNNYPTLYRGVLCSNGENGTTTKGSVLLAFLEAVNISPKVIIMIDDKKKNLESVKDSLDTHQPNIQFIGIEYQGTFDYAPEDISREKFKAFWQDLVDRALNDEEKPSQF